MCETHAHPTTFLFFKKHNGIVASGELGPSHQWVGSKQRETGFHYTTQVKTLSYSVMPTASSNRKQA